MRSDFAKLLCEHPRVGGETDSRERRKNRIDWKRDPEHAATHGRMRTYYRDRKSFGEFLSPLTGFLRARVGHRWDDVYSEIRRNFKPTSAQNLHIYTHLEGYVSYEGEIGGSSEFVVGQDGILHFGTWEPYRYARTAKTEGPPRHVPIDGALYEVTWGKRQPLDFPWRRFPRLARAFRAEESTQKILVSDAAPLSVRELSTREKLAYYAEKAA